MRLRNHEDWIEPDSEGGDISRINRGTASSDTVPVHLAFFGGLGDGPGLFHTQIVENVASTAFHDPAKIGLDGVQVASGSLYLEWWDAAFGRPKAKRMLGNIPKTQPPIPVIVIAHSYGADAAIRTLGAMHTSVDHLVTIDGVSWKSKCLGDGKPPGVVEWTNVYASGISTANWKATFVDLVAVAGGHWQHRRAADRNIDATTVGEDEGERLHHGSFFAMWRLAVPYVRQSLGLRASPEDPLS